MIVLHPNEEQYTALNGYTNGVNKLIFAIDGSDRYIVGLEVLDDPNFSKIREQLLELEQITYTPTE
jgi:predicted secreted Zn-dependent protease